MTPETTTSSFFREIADVLEESDGDAGYAVLPEQHRFQIPDEVHWNTTRANVYEVGNAIQDALKGYRKRQSG
ncbi:hypothetical protein [uncultured Bilophila sp.]|uniref:hypothetical protein n=1 Tax=uncultured Bilophila sp. TaxID=529385 RepID=UPI0026705644|nr:hypothetical protein [uncultured Bilophila sp.]